MYVLEAKLTKKPTLETWDLVSGLLYQFHSLGIEELNVPNPDTSNDFEPVLEQGVLDPPKEFLSYFHNFKDAERAQRAIETALLELKPIYKISEVEEKNYAEIWKENFKPIECEPNWLIKAPWHDQKPKKGQIELILEPGMAFGTGSHDTTKGCLTLMTKVIEKEKVSSLLDFGCGSGILAIAAKKLKVPNVVGVDIDPLAVDASKKNARDNDVEFEVLVQEQEFKNLDLIVANILKNTLINFKDSFYGWLKPKGHLILSGILAEQKEEVIDAFKKTKFTICDEVISKTQDDNDRWACLLLQKNN